MAITEGGLVLKLFNTTNGVTEVTPWLAEAEADVQALVESAMELMLGVRFLATEYSTGPVHGGRIDSLGLDENGAPVIVEYKRATDPGVLSQGLFYMAWLMDHREEFEALVRERLGSAAAAGILWSAPRLICVAGGFTRYDEHAVHEHRRSIDLVRYTLLGEHHIALETVASVAAQGSPASRKRGRGKQQVAAHQRTGAMTALAAVVDEALRGLGEGVKKVERKQYDAYQRLRNFACVAPRQDKLLVYLKVAPAKVELVPGFTRDVTGLGHHGTGDLEVQLRSEKDVERALELFRLSYASA
ncbi:transporter [Streptomyces sp. NPDC008122]|uniref:transporter n=1 Tax=Streptomyces sp. NPDC008122 TaxID=3364810 RepID=UPI0036E621A4